MNAHSHSGRPSGDGMIPENIALVFLIAPILCLVYIFRGLGENQNPIWGNILASGIGAILCAMIALWLLSGTIVSTTIVGNSTYQLDAGVTDTGNLTQTSNVIGTGGSGMFTRSAMSTADSVPNATVTVYTYDIIAQQTIDMGLMFFYVLIGMISALACVYFIIDARNVILDQEYYEENNYGED